MEFAATGIAASAGFAVA